MHSFTWRAFMERGCLAGWMVLMAVNTIILGLAIELLFTDDKKSVEEARRLFTHYSHTFANSLLERERKKP